MNLRQLNCFLTVCRTGSISQSAGILHLSQPALTRQIQALESEFGTQFFERRNRRIFLTAEGRAFEAYARDTLTHAQKIRETLNGFKTELDGSVTVGCVESSASDVLGEFAADWLTRFPNVRLNIFTSDGDTLRRELDDGRLDAALVIEPIEIIKYETLPFGKAERWGIVVRENSPLADRDSVSADDLRNMPVMLPLRPLAQSQLLVHLGLSESSVQYRAAGNLLTNLLPILKAFGGGALCIERSFTMRPVKGLTFIPVHPVYTSRHSLIRVRRRGLSPVAERFWTDFETFAASITDADDPN